MDEDKTQFLKYLSNFYVREKRMGQQLLYLGMLAVSLAIYGLFYANNLVWSGAWPPLALIGVLHILAGYNVIAKGIIKRVMLEVRFETEPADVFKTELVHMEKVQATYKKHLTIEIIFFGLGFILMILGALVFGGKYMLGSGVAITAQVGIKYMLDLTSSYRTSFYQSKLLKFQGRLKDAK